jgi:hypothetical protein
MSNPGVLRIAYVANLVILAPVLWSMFSSVRMADVFDGKVANSDGIRLMVASLWSAILFGSLIGLRWPEAMSLIVVIQIFYKTMWLVSFIGPHAVSGRREQIPVGITACFVAIVVTYPVIYWFAR